jgi:predicted O-methyltransferase YrrM
MISFNSLKVRLKLIASLLRRDTNTWVDELTNELEKMGLKYRHAKANLNLLDFWVKLSNNLNIRDFKRLDYSKITTHDFFKEVPELDHGWNSEHDVARLIGDLAYNHSAIKVVETGCFVGFGSAHLASALCALGSEREFFMVDSSRQFLNTTKNNLSLLSLDKVSLHFIEGTTWDKNVLNVIPDNVDIIFLDSAHSYEGIKKELDCYLPKLSKNGLLNCRRNMTG